MLRNVEMFAVVLNHNVETAGIGAHWQLTSGV